MVKISVIFFLSEHLSVEGGGGGGGGRGGGEDVKLIH